MLERRLIQLKSTLAEALWLTLLERRTLERSPGLHVTAQREADEISRMGLEMPGVAFVLNGIDLPSQNLFKSTDPQLDERYVFFLRHIK